MYANGVSHVAVNNELKAVTAILRWLSYVPAARGRLLPSLNLGDPIDRPVQFVPKPSTPYDPRHMLAGCVSDDKMNYGSGDDGWISGFFDRGSFFETLAGWAKTVVCGRARLGGIPIAVIAAETRMMEKVIPADPANQESQQSIVQQAGGVWFPDSAYKTAQAIKDFNKGEELPLLIFANWRGFSGGMRDMFDEILKFGSYIVDNLRDYRQPVFVYIPPAGELRGGAWAVLDPTINPDMMEMYAAEDCRGGVLEPSGTVEIKYRDRDLRETMRRLDPTLIQLQQSLSELEENSEKSGGDVDQKKKAIRQQIATREEELLPMYRQVAIEFAGLHDTPGRMKAKGVISEIIPWASSRRFFYHRLRRRMAEHQLRKRMSEACQGSMSHLQLVATLRLWFSRYLAARSSSGGSSASSTSTSTSTSKSSSSASDLDVDLDKAWADDERVYRWMEEESCKSIEAELTALRQETIYKRGVELASQDLDTWKRIVLDTLASLPPEKRNEFAQLLAKAAK